MTVEIDVPITQDIIGGILEQLDYDVPRTDIDTVMYHVFDTLITDIAEGETEWPVDTGYSIASFFTDGYRLYNYADYAIYVEGNTSAIANYVHANIHELVEIAADLSGAPKQVSEARIDFAQLAADVFATVVAPEIIDLATPVDSNLIVRAGVLNLSRINRRLVRAYRPRGYRDYIFRDSPRDG